MRTILLFLFIIFIASNTSAHNDSDHRSYQFIENKGQFENEVKYKAKINGGALFIEKNAFTFHLQDNSILNKSHLNQEVKKEEQSIKGHAYKMIFENALDPKFIATDKSTEYYNYYLGNDKSKWVSEAFAYENIRMKNIYQNIDLEITTNENENLKYTYYLKPGADASVIRQKYVGIENMKLVNGNLMLVTLVNEVKEMKPIAWQIINGKKHIVKCNFKLNGQTITYDFPDGYDASQELVIDPVLIFGSYTGSTADNFGMTATYDSQGNLITGGMAYNVGFPTTPGAYDNTSNVNDLLYGVTDVVITKFNSTGTSLVFSTYIGGGTDTTGTETVHSLICDANDNLFLFGVTSSTDFPTTAGCFDNTFNGGTMIGFYNNGTYFYDGGTDIYVSKFNSSGTALLASTYIGGSDNDGVNYNRNYLAGQWFSDYDSLQFNYGDQFRGEIMVDDLGNCYVATTTRSADFPTVNAYQSILAGKQDAVAFKFDSDLTALTWSTFIGGTEKDAAYSIKVDENYVAYIAGGTVSNNFPTTAGTLHTTYRGGKTDGFILKISANGSTLLASSFIGTNLYDQVFFVELDRFGDVYLLGQTQGTNTYPIINVAVSNPNSGQFITKLDNNLTAIIYSTLFGNSTGNINISPSAFLVDVCGNIYVSGWGGNILTGPALNGMPVTSDAFQPSNGDGYNFYLIVFSRNIQSTLYASYFGGGTSREHVDGGTSRFDANGVVYQSVCAGCGNSNDDFPTTPGVWSNQNLSTNCNNGVFKYDFEIEPDAAFITSDTAGCAPLTLTFNNTSPIFTDYFWDFGNNDTTSIEFNPTRTFPTPGTYTVYLIVEDSVCGLLMDTAMQIITVYPPLQLSTNDTTMCEGEDYLLLANSMGTSSVFYWSTNGNFSDTINNPSDSSLVINTISDTTFYIAVTNGYCTEKDTVNIFIPRPSLQITGDTNFCSGDTSVLTVINNAPQYPITSYDWYPDSLIISGDGTASVIISASSTNWIGLSCTTGASSCIATDSVLISVGLPPVGNVNAFADDYIIAIGSSTTLHATPSGYTYLWTPPFTLDNPSSQNPLATPTVTTTYTVIVNNNGCMRQDTVLITVVDVLCEDPYIFVPNAFTPNGDNENDFLKVRFPMDAFNYEYIFRVYNRWGEKVWECNQFNTTGWDGTFQGRDCDPAVFDYYLDVLCPGGDKYFKKGNITLIR